MPMNGSVPDRSEDRFLDRIRKACTTSYHDERVIIDIGDDAFAFSALPGISLISTDIGIEGVHFSDSLSPEDIGYRIMAANLSDIAAMGGVPRYAFVALGLPGTISEEYLVSLYRGFNEAASPSNCTIRGGDLSLSHSLVIAITVYGETDDAPLSRNGAGDNDFLYLTGNPGLSRVGLELILEGNADESRFPVALSAHRRPRERSALVNEIKRIYRPSAMIDLSDGLSTDLTRLAKGSKTGCILESDKLHREDELIAYCAMKNADPLEYILSSGEEYELVFTSPLLIPQQTIEGIPVRQIGLMAPGSCYITAGDKKAPLASTGYDHFREIP